MDFLKITMIIKIEYFQDLHLTKISLKLIVIYVVIIIFFHLQFLIYHMFSTLIIYLNQYLLFY
jgi:hypothetical protein